MITPRVQDRMLICQYGAALLQFDNDKDCRVPPPYHSHLTFLDRDPCKQTCTFPRMVNRYQLQFMYLIFICSICKPMGHALIYIQLIHTIL